MTSQDNENREEFDALLEDLESNVVSLELVDFEGTSFKHNTSGASEDQYASIKTLYASETAVQVQSITYDGIKYMFLKCIQDEGKKPVYIFISTEADKDGIKKGMFITGFFTYALIATFEHKKINKATAKIISVLEEYQVEE
ncbi:hypothetical protein NGRA_0072 [Nosema granulosis]|uniref:Uncharacterized protein n=1 Tax=Nosema granulosis TaxID=83296 RepID=A0A9P6H4B1_9MICR|nr:hypothetical protein NGRA_0072 [Nosema granulosis]